MPSRLETESAELARALRAATDDDRRRASETLVRRACIQFDPPLAIPSEEQALDALIDQLDATGDERDAFRRARAATAVRFHRRGEYDEALYEALHAHSVPPDAIAEARATLLL